MRRTQTTVAGFEDRRGGPGAKECRWLLEAGKDEEAYPSLEPPERNIAVPHLDFSSVRPVLDF